MDFSSDKFESDGSSDRVYSNFVDVIDIESLNDSKIPEGATLFGKRATAKSIIDFAVSFMRMNENFRCAYDEALPLTLVNGDQISISIKAR